MDNDNIYHTLQSIKGISITFYKKYETSHIGTNTVTVIFSSIKTMEGFE